MKIANYKFLIYFLFFLQSWLIAIDSPKNYKKQLFELLEIPLDSQVNEELYIMLVDKLENLEIEEEELSYGYEFMGGYRGLKNYINKNAKRLLILMDVEFPDEVKDNNLNNSFNEEGVDTLEVEGAKLLLNESEHIEKENDLNENINNYESNLLSLSIYYSAPLILSQTTKEFDRSSSNIYGANIILPYKLKRLSRFLEILTKREKGALNPRMVIELRQYYFEKIISDSSSLIFGGSDYIFIGFYDNYSFNGKSTEFSFLFGKTHFNSLGVILTNSIQLPINLDKMKLKMHLVTKATLMHKVAKNNEYGSGDYTGWIDIGLSLSYEFDINKFISKKGLIKRRQTIFE